MPAQIKRVKKTRKEHMCNECFENVTKGSKAIVLRDNNEYGTWTSLYWHDECFPDYMEETVNQSALEDAILDGHFEANK